MCVCYVNECISVRVYETVCVSEYECESECVTMRVYRVYVSECTYGNVQVCECMRA